MSPNDNDTVLVQDELITLKARADLLGVAYHPSIGLEKLREKVSAAIAGKPDEPAEPAATPVETANQKRLRLHAEASKQVRIRVMCMNPEKKEWSGEIFTVGNGAVGTFKKYVPFGNDEGWHVPHIIYQQLLERQCQVFVTVKDARGNSLRKGKLIREFAVEVLPPLTEDEMKDLAQRQAMSHAIDA